MTEDASKIEKEDSITGTVDLTAVPNWKDKPVSLLWPLGHKPAGLTIISVDKSVALPHSAQNLKDQIPQTHTSFPGPLANLDSLSFSKEGVIRLASSQTDFFAYKAAAYNFRDRQGENPVRPLSVQATLVTPDGRLIIERRLTNLEDFPGTLSVFGGSINPEGAKNPTETLRAMLQKKQGLDLQPDQLELTGIGRDNINNVFTIFYVAQLQEGQTEALLNKFSQERESKEKVFYVISADSSLGYIEKLLEHRNVSRWNPLGFANLLYALSHTGARTSEEIQQLLEKTGKLDKSFSYKYPMERIIEEQTQA